MNEISTTVGNNEAETEIAEAAAASDDRLAFTTTSEITAHVDLVKTVNFPITLTVPMADTTTTTAAGSRVAMVETAAATASNSEEDKEDVGATKVATNNSKEDTAGTDNNSKDTDSSSTSNTDRARDTK